MTTILFLDVDGVLHPWGTPATARGYIRWTEPTLFVFRPLLESALAPYPSVRIVISSSWRFMCDDRELKERVLGPVLAPRFVGITDDERTDWTRAGEVLAYVADRAVTSWLVLDDDRSVEELAAEDSRWIWCPPEYGLGHPRALGSFNAALAETDAAIAMAATAEARARLEELPEREQPGRDDRDPFAGWVEEAP